MPNTFNLLIKQVKSCTLCQTFSAIEANPVLQVSPSAKVLIAGQAPGIKVHQSGIPFDDKSGERLRAWLGVSPDIFYNKAHIAILPMAFCYPGKGASGDLPPRPECADKWRKQILSQLPNIELVIAIGSYAQDWHLPNKTEKTLTDTVKNWQYYVNNTTPTTLPIPHPSPRNNIWLKRNDWFEKDVIPTLQLRVSKVLAAH
ncbi:MAG: uracil-DNA glycosylase family protein [Colwellia sp.]|nr:uracil-DNA glycosylase family protein [Colwellia sp.]MCW8866527.1 uracil-DNA glycosylase family protein [Colwellia sp.]MCW9079985.1 uracil-DNA glycosylase family protein [Colwellia sp.]